MQVFIIEDSLNTIEANKLTKLDIFFLKSIIDFIIHK